MTDAVSDLARLLAGLLAAWAALEILGPPLLRALARALPDDICGPGGWYVDTEAGVGVFDRRRRRRGRP